MTDKPMKLRDTAKDRLLMTPIARLASLTRNARTLGNKTVRLNIADAEAIYTAMRQTSDTGDDDALTDEQVERVAYFVEHSPTHPPGDCREMVSRKLVRQIIEAYRLQAKAHEGEG
jgi:hypothetical protein